MISQKLQIKLFHNSGLSWFHKDNFYAKGYLYDSEGNYYSGYELIELISTFDLDAFLNFLREANGAFAIIWKKEENTVLAVDPIRSIPVFYSWHEESFVVSDDALAIARFKGKQTLDESIYKFIRLSGFAPGNSTLFPDIHQLNGGQYLHLKNNSVSTQPEFYYRHFHKSDRVSSESLWKERFSLVLNNIFYRLIDSLKNNTIVIPLSGGFDSRLIAAMLKEMEYENVICYTYGRENSYEVKIAKEVARNLQFPWYFIEYKADLFEKYFDSQAKDYREFAGNCCCSVQEQEYFAVSELVSRKLIPDNSVFVPGYCGDLPAGSYLPNRYQVSRIVQSKSNAIDFIIEKHFKSHRDNPDFRVIKENLQELFGTAEWKDIDDFISIHENWFTLNKVSKYVVNGIRAFEFFGYQWRLPLWDKEFIGFFYSLPNE